MSSRGVPADQPQRRPFTAVTRGLLPASPSRLATFEACPRRYRFAYLDRPAPRTGPPWAHVSLGMSVHAALHTWWTWPRAKRDPERLAGLLVASWKGGGWRDRAQQVRWQAQALEWLRAYVRRWAHDGEPVALERTVAFKTATMAFSGRLDRLDERAGELVVVDYKTGRHPPDSEAVRTSAALALYAEATSRTLRRPCRRVELHHLPSGVEVGFEHTPDSLARQVRRADALAGEIAAVTSVWEARTVALDEAFPARPGALCSWCDYRAHCPEGRAAAPERSSWAALEPAESIDADGPGDSGG